LDFDFQGRRMKRLLLLAVFILTGCTGIPEGIEPVENFELEPYLGTWYEIARLDHSFERGMSNVTANYSLRDDGGVKVLNRGYRSEKSDWDEAEGKAYFIGDSSIGRLKVSFFGPFYGAYNIFELGENYEYSMVAGPDRSYLWILAREPRLPQAMLDELLDKANAAGYDTSALIFVKHDKIP
jgi:apolipoprotein D and lipocalin family protein